MWNLFKLLPRAKKKVSYSEKNRYFSTEGEKERKIVGLLRERKISKKQNKTKQNKTQQNKQTNKTKQKTTTTTTNTKRRNNN